MNRNVKQKQGPKINQMTDAELEQAIHRLSEPVARKPTAKVDRVNKSGGKRNPRSRRLGEFAPAPSRYLEALLAEQKFRRIESLSACVREAQERGNAVLGSST